MKLRDYQDAAVTAIFDYFDAADGNPIVALPTGTGKSLVIGSFIQKAVGLYPGTRVLKLTHVKELIQQNYAKLLDLWPTAPAGVYSAGLKRKEAGFPITFAGIASAVHCPEVFGHVDLVLIDEAHLVSPKEGTMYQDLILALRTVNPKIKVIGLTATQYRLGQGKLIEPDGLFTDVCFDMTSRDSFNWLIQQGYLVPLVPKRTTVELDTTRVKTHAGEFVLKDLQAAVDVSPVTQAILRETISLGQNRDHWLIFASGVDHAVHVTEALESMGVDALCVHSRMGTEARDKAITDFRAGKVRAMVNNGILTTGFDFPGIDMIVMMRPTQSPGLWVQMLGRGTRTTSEVARLETPEQRLAAIANSEKRNCLVLDFAGNTRRLGPINDPVLPRRKGEGGGGTAPVKVCEECGTYCHCSVRICDFCGAAFPIKQKLVVEASTDALIASSEVRTELFDVTRVTYAEHHKEGKPPSIVVSYYCGLRRFREWVCLEHVGFAQHKARGWWRERTTVAGPLPVSTGEGLSRISELRTPRQLRVWVRDQNPEVMGYVY